VAATIGAPFEQGPAGSRAFRGVVGGNPESDLHLVPWLGRDQRTSQEGVTVVDMALTLKMVLDARPTLFPQLKVINVSGKTVLIDASVWDRRWATDTCGPSDDDDAAPGAQPVACTPNTLDQYLREFRALAEMTRPVVERVLGTGAVLVVAAGNEARDFCTDVPPRTVACENFDRPDTSNIHLFGWVDRTWHRPSGRGSPVLMAESYEATNAIASYSNVGTIAAPGTVVSTDVLPSGTATYGSINGTSFAAPMTTAAVGVIAELNPTMQGDAIVAHLKQRARSDVAGTVTPRIDVFEAALSLPGVAARLVDVNDPSPDGNRRTLRRDDGTVYDTDTTRSATTNGPRWSAPDGRVDMRDFRVFRDAWLDGCRSGGAIVSAACPPSSAIVFDGGNFHPKFDTNLDGCISADGLLPFCDRSETLFSRLDFNGDGKLDDRRVLVPLTSTGAVAPPGQGTLMSDLDVLASRWGVGAGADTGGYDAADLPRLLSSADIELRLERLWEAGATSATVEAVSIATLEELWQETVTKPPAGQVPWKVITLPVWPSVDPSLVQVRITTTLPPRADPVVYLSEPLDARPGEDLTLSPCVDRLTVSASPAAPTPGGTTRIEAQLVDCQGVPVVGEDLRFDVLSAFDGSRLGGETFVDGVVAPVISRVTDFRGRASVDFTFPVREVGPSAVRVSTNPGIGALAPMRAIARFGGAFDFVPGLTVFYRSREVIEEYERFSTNLWGEDTDDCEGPIDATGSPYGCFASRQRLAFPDSIGLEPGVVMIDRRGRIEVEDRLAWDSLRIIGGLEADEYDPSVHYGFVPLVTNLLEWPAGNIAAATDREVFSAIDITAPGSPSYEWSSEYPIPLPDITYTLNAAGLNVYGLAAVNDSTYWQGTTHNIQNFGSLASFHPDAPLGRYREFGPGPRHQIPTELGVLNRIDGSSFPFARDVDGPLTVRRSPDGRFLTYTYCGRNDRPIDSGGGYWNDTDPLEPWGRDPDKQRFERRPGDRAAPKHEGVVRGKSIFVATVSLDGSAPPAGILDLPECDPPGGDASFIVSPNPQEGNVVRFTPATSRTAVDGGLEYAWSFGDGNTSTERIPEHLYEDSGEYIVTLTVTDPRGGVGVSSQQISVANTPPNLWIEAARVNGQNIEFDLTVGEFSAVDGLGITVAITGSSGFPVVPASPYPIGTHTVTVPDVNPGAYTVTIFAIDKDGGTASRTVQLTVTSSPPPSGAVQPLMMPLSASVDESPPPPPPTQAMGFRSAPAELAAATVGASSAADPLASAAIPAFVLSRLDTTTATTVQVRNASINNGAPVGTVFDLGDGRTAVPITAGATATITYLAAGEFSVTTALAGVSARSPLTVTGAPLVPVVTYLGATSGAVGQEVEVSARVTATTSTGFPVAGRPLEFTLRGVTVTAVSGADGVALTRLRVAPPAGSTTIAVNVAASGGDSGATTSAGFTVLANEPPTADAGGPYTVPIDGVLSLQATGTDADDGPTALGFRWDLDGDGDFDDAIGNDVALTNQQLTSLVCRGTCASGQSYSIAVRVTDPKGATAVASTTVTPIADFGLTITPASATLVPNSQTSFTVNVVSTNGFTTPVALSAPSLPPDVTATFSPSTVTPNGSSVLTLRAGAGVQATPGTPLIVRGTAGGLVRETGGSVSLEFGLLPVCYGTITGVVRDADTGEPLRGFPVDITSILRSTTTDDEGRYRFEQLPVASDNGPLAYGLRSNPIGYETRFFGATAACNVVTTADTTVTRLRFGTITGRVFLADPTGAIIGPLPNVAVTGPAGPATDAQGRYTKQNVALNPGGTPRTYFLGVNGVANVRHPAAQASVTVRADEIAEQDLVSYQMCFGSVRGRMIDEATGLAIPGARMSIGSRTVVANAQGVAVMNDIPLGAPNNSRVSLSVTGRPPTGTTLFRPPTAAVLPRCGAITPVEVPVTMPVENFATIAATIVDAETGLPVQGLQLGTANGARSPGTSNAQGRVDWRVSLGLNNTTGNISVFAVGGNGYFSSATQGLTLTANGTTPVTFQVLRARTGSVEGRVTDAITGAALSAITVVMGFRTTTTDADGRYRFDNVGLQAGNLPTPVTVTARDNFNVFEPIAYWFQQQTVTVEADRTATADFALLPVCQGANVRGRVINAATGEPLEGALVGTGQDTQLTDAEGRFSFTDLRVSPQNAPRSITMSASKTGFTSATRQVTLFCGADIVVDFGTTDPTTGTITGRVTDEDGLAVPNVFVGTEFGGAAATDSDGRYTVSAVPTAAGGAARDWQVTFIPPLSTGLRSATSTATVTSGATSTVDAVLARGGGATNQSPTARITGALTATEGSTVTLSAATSSDPDGTIALYEWDLGANGSYEVSSADATTFDVTLPDNGIVTVRLRVTDDGAVAATTTFAVTFTNVAPVVSLADDLAIDGLRITRAGSFSDPGTADTHLATVDWGAGDGPQPLALSRGAFDLDHAYTQAGTYNVVVEVCDDDDGGTVEGCGTATFEVGVTQPNRAPTATVASVATRQNRPVAIVLVGADPDGDHLTFAIVDPPVNGTLSGVAPNLVYTPTDGYVGDDRLTFTVSDSESTSVPAEISIRVTDANVAPTATITGPDSTTEGSTVTLSASTSSDPDGTIVAYEWDVDDDGTIDATDATIPISRDDDGSVTVRLNVTDDEGLVGTTTVTVTFTNVAPTVTLADDLVVGADRRLTRTGSLTDPGVADTHTATVDWGEGASAEELVLNGAGFELDHTFGGPGTYTVVVEVCDDDDSGTVEGCGAAQFTFTITPPRVNVGPTAVATGSLTALEGATVTVSGTDSSDPDGSIVRFDWDLDGDGLFERTGPTTDVSLPDQGQVTVALRVTDDDGASDATTRTITFTDVPPLIVLDDDLTIGADGSVSRTGRIVDPGVDDGHSVTVDWGDGSPPRSVEVSDRRFTLHHTYASGAALGSGLVQRLGSSYLVVVEACDTAISGACGSSTFEVDPFVPEPTADLAVSVSVPDGLTAGGFATVTLDVVNAGPAQAAGVRLVLTLPGGAVAASPSAPGWDCSVDGSAVTCVPDSGLLPVGAWTIRVPVTVTSSRADQLSFAATISSTTADPVTANNEGRDATVTQPTRDATPPAPVAPAPPPPVDTTPIPPLSTELPQTGSGVGHLISLSFALALLGSLLALGSRRRRPSST
jgi:PKD repeat protein